MTTTKKLTLLLLPLVPLTAIGIVEIAGTIATPDREPICELPTTPQVAPAPVPAPAPQTVPVA